jgi:hypothetical protein
MMKPKSILTYVFLLIACGLPLLSVLSASAVGIYSIDWWTIDDGGAISSTGGDFSLAGTIGQPEYGTSSAESYSLSGGFWGGGAAEIYRVILMLIFR